MINRVQSDIIDRLAAMRAQGETIICSNYFQNDVASNGVNESCRRAMATWVGKVQKTLDLSPESVWISMSFLDRYLSSGRGNSREVLKSKNKFQLAAITAFFTAVKIYEPVVLGLDTMTQICRGTYAESDIMAMECDILAALDWRVSYHTPMDFARHLLELLPEELPTGVADTLLKDCQKNVDYATMDVHFSSYSPSVLGTSCLATSLRNSGILSISEKQAFWSRLSELWDFDLASTELKASQQHLQSFASPCKPGLAQKLNQISRPNTKRPSSPVCIAKAARQA